jgi:Tol biopolymer transport system component
MFAAVTKAPFFCLVALVAGVALSGCSPPVVRDSASSRGSPSPGLPMGGRVLFSAGGEDLWSSLPDGGDRERITTDGKTTGDYYVGGRWSPDGRVIAAERSMAHESGNALYLIELAGHSALRLTQPDTFLDGYSWSPDGRLLAYAEVTSGGTLAAGGTLSGGVGAVHVYDRAARTDRIVAPGNHPAFSPDGRLIGFAHAAGAVAVVPPEGGAATFLANLPELSRYSILAAPKGMALLSGPAWSSDGRYVAYSAIERGPILEALQVIYVQEALPNAPPHQWAIGKTGAAHHVADLRWSPTAPVLAYAFIYAQPHHHYLGTIDPSRADLHPLFDSANHFLDYSWSPDGSTILLQIDDSDEWVYIAAGTGAIVRRSTPGGWRPDWCRCPTN